MSKDKKKSNYRLRGNAAYGNMPSLSFAGEWRNWLAHRTVDPVVAGSNPVSPAILSTAVFSRRFFCSSA